jgi:hypothetical protein
MSMDDKACKICNIWVRKFNEKLPCKTPKLETWPTEYFNQTYKYNDNKYL